MPGNPGHRDPRTYVIIKPLPIVSQKGLKVQARSESAYNCWEPTREQVFWANYQRRQKQLTVGFRSPCSKPYQALGAPLFLEAKKLILHSLGQAAQDSKDEELAFSEEDQEIPKALKDSQEKTKPILKPAVYQKHRENDRRCLQKELSHTRQLVSASRQGRGYFYLLKKEKEDNVAQQCEETRHKETSNIVIEPSKHSSSDEEEEKQHHHAHPEPCRVFPTEVRERRKLKKNGGGRSRPFTPVHNSLYSENLNDANPEPLFRQLCALHWLLEALYIEPFSAMRPVSTCWSAKEPGGTKSTLKRISKEKEVEAKWDHFTMQGKAKKPTPRALRSQFQRPRKLSFMSTSRYSALSASATPTLGSVSSLIPSSDEVAPAISVSSDMLRDDESTAYSSIHQGRLAKEEEEPRMSYYLQSLLEEIRQSVLKELDEEENQKKNRLVRVTSISAIQEKTIIPEYVEQEHENIPKQRPKSSPSVHNSLTSKFVKEKWSMPSEMRQKFFEVADEAHLCLRNNVDAIEKFCSLLARIPESLRRNPKIQRILSRLEKLEGKQYIKIRPNAFLKVLNGMRPFELCSPDICVAIEFVRETFVQMSPEEYAAWLQTRVTSNCQRAQSAPPIR
ncbi:coiled-coil domain-containing protein 60 isoform X2 [Ambystoma mexicanum]|uniref:coiled-coil domain-containing protein 60 isoform X2 n=1 Tax=Ambystoma mexicanum TaxID=8296 RepID=UPI0037E80761